MRCSWMVRKEKEMEMLEQAWEGGGKGKWEDREKVEEQEDRSKKKRGNITRKRKEEEENRRKKNKSTRRMEVSRGVEDVVLYGCVIKREE